MTADAQSLLCQVEHLCSMLGKNTRLTGVAASAGGVRSSQAHLCSWLKHSLAGLPAVALPREHWGLQHAKQTGVPACPATQACLRALRSRLRSRVHAYPCLHRSL